MILFTELKKVVLNSESVNKAMPILCVQLRTPFRVPRVSVHESFHCINICCVFSKGETSPFL